MTLKPPTRSLPKLVMKEWPEPYIVTAVTKKMFGDISSYSSGTSVLGLLTKPLHMPEDLVVATPFDADEAGDYRVVRHGDVVGDPNWIITNIDPKDLD